jgi:hypothetical protein
MRSRGPLVLAALGLSLASACAAEDVVLFRAPAQQMTGGAAGKGGTSGAAGKGGESAVITGGSAVFPSGGSGGLPAFGGAGRGGEGGFRDLQFCRTDLDCQSSWWCQKPDCFAPIGECTPPQVFCNESPAPVCGCDGITYWNDCVRREAATPAATPGECRTDARPCSKAQDCGTENAECAFLYPRPDRCDEPPSGTCWVLPLACPPGDPLSDDARWVECLREPLPYDMPPPDFPKCVDTCAAIRSGRAHVRPLRGAPCPE